MDFINNFNVILAGKLLKAISNYQSLVPTTLTFSKDDFMEMLNDELVLFILFVFASKVSDLGPFFSIECSPAAATRTGIAHVT